MAMADVRIRTPGYQALWIALPVVMAAAVLMGVADPAPPLEPGWSLDAVVWLIACALVAARTFFLGVRVSDHSLLVTNFYSTRRLSRAEVVDIRAVQYDGLLAPVGSWYWTTVRIRLRSGREVVAYGLVGRRMVVKRVVAKLRTACELEAPARSRSHVRR